MNRGEGVMRRLVIQAIVPSLLALPILLITSCASESKSSSIKRHAITVTRIAGCPKCPEYKLAILPDGEVNFTGIRYVKHLGTAQGRLDSEALSRLDKALEDVRLHVRRNRYVIENLADAEIFRLQFAVEGQPVRTMEFDPALTGQPITALTRLVILIEEAAKPFGWIR